MTLDDRLRAAHQRRLAATRDRLEAPVHAEADAESGGEIRAEFDGEVELTSPSAAPSLSLAAAKEIRPRRSARVLAIAAAVAVLAAGTLAVTTPWADDASINAGPAADGSGSALADGDSGGEPGTGSEAAPGPPGTASPDVGADGTETDGEADEGADSGDGSGSDEADADGSSPASTADALEEPGGVAVDSAVCPTGRRAELERATLRYVGTNEGWGRLDDLVDEQGGPYYFSGWEPGYPDTVTVEIELADPVTAVEIRLAQDPYTPVEGAVTVEVDGSSAAVALSGTGGWRVHRLAAPTVLDSFRLTRSQPEANVMEVFVCLEARLPGTPENPGDPDSPDGGPTTTAPIDSITPPRPTLPAPGGPTTTIPVGADPHPATPGVRDSFGEVTAPDRSTMAWRAVDAYYADGTRPGQCSKELHDSYWVEGSDGRIYPTWHPVNHPSGCSFMHSHGDDPRSSELYGPSVGLPFGMAAQAQEPGDPMRRNEDHVGHKVVREDDWGAVEGNPVNDGDQLRATGITCQWLSKIHQGTYSQDALGNNLHEYFLNLSCTDGTEIRVKEMAFWGEPGRIFNECSASSVNRFGFTHGWIDAGVTAIPDRQPPYVHDGKREFQCVPDVFYRSDGELSELWKPDGQLSTPDGGSVLFSPYYIVTNPARVVDPNWRANGRSNGWVPTIDFCFDDTDAWDDYVAVAGGGRPTFCRDVPASLASVPAADRWRHPDSPFDGSETAIHPKGPMIFNAGRRSNHPDGTQFCTDAFGQNPTWPAADGTCGPNQLVQLIATIDNGWAGRISGSDVNAGPGLIAPGISNEWTRDFGTDVNVPN